MKVEYTGRQTDVTDELRGLAERKLQKLAKVLRGITAVHVVLAEDKRRQTAEVSVHSPHLDLAAGDEGPDLGLALSTVFDKLTRQAKRHQGKLRQRKRRAPARATALWSGVLAPAAVGDGREGAGTAGAAGTARVIRSRRFVVKPMTVEEAVLHVGASPDEFLVFRDASTERVNVLYKRRDGNLGLIEPEA
jgi:putative sigma-54 modulation protein